MPPQSPAELLLAAMLGTINRHRLIDPGDAVLVAASGGIDSMVLLDALVSLSGELRITVAVGHMNHGLRGGESDGDEELVRKISSAYGLSCHVEHAKTSELAAEAGIAIQEAARDARYAFFKSLQSKHGYRKVATAHHADDNAETVLFNVLRGTGVRGMTGIPVRRDDEGIIRPLLEAGRAQIVDYAAAKNLQYREDSTNEGVDYSRNFIRHRLLPEIRERINPAVTAAINRSAEIFRGLESFLESASAGVLAEIAPVHSRETLVIELPSLLKQPEFMQEYIIHRLLRSYTAAEADYSTVQAVLNLARTETGSACSLKGDALVYRNRGQLIFVRGTQPDQWYAVIEQGKTYDFEKFSFSSVSVRQPVFTRDPGIEFVDADSLGSDLILRSWREGDWFIPFGMTSRKKVSDFFIDQKIPLFEKNEVPILESDGEIVWICGYRLDDRHKISDTTRAFLRLEYHQRSHGV